MGCPEKRLRGPLTGAEGSPMKRMRSRLSSQAGFTLIELMVVVIIISILVAMAIANYIRMQEHAKKTSCVSNQRNIYQAATIYASDHKVDDGEMGVEDLLAERAVPRGLCECASSKDSSFDDYTIVWLDGLPREVKCDIKGDKHLWHHH
jgi:prepilin-type N-terminal cleavage/methylation domain-containing protein